MRILNGVVVSSSVATNTLKVGTSTTSGYVLTADASGNATWQVAAGGGGAAAYLSGEKWRSD